MYKKIINNRPVLTSIKPLGAGKNPYFPHWWHYRVLSKEIERYWGEIDGLKAMNVLRNMYQGKHDFLMFFATRLTNLVESWHQWVFCPETGDIWVSFAGGGKSASYNKVHNFNFFDLLE